MLGTLYWYLHVTIEYTIKSRGYRFVKYVRFRRLDSLITLCVKIIRKCPKRGKCTTIQMFIKIFPITYLYIYISVLWRLPDDEDMRWLAYILGCRCLSVKYASTPLHWRHNDHGGVSNHQPHVCLLNRAFRRRSNKMSKLRVTGLCAGNSPGTGEFPAQMTSNAEYVSIGWRHNVSVSLLPTDSSPHWNVAPWCIVLGPNSIQRWHPTSIGNPIVEIRRSYDRLISTMGFPILIRRHLYIESGPCNQSSSLMLLIPAKAIYDFL